MNKNVYFYTAQCGCEYHNLITLPTDLLIFLDYNHAKSRILFLNILYVNFTQKIDDDKMYI